MASYIPIKENGFEGAPAGRGSMNYGTGYGTPNSSTQDPSKFSSSDKTTNHMSSNLESTSSAMMKLPDRPDRQSTNISSANPHPENEKENELEPVSSQSSKNIVDQDTDKPVVISPSGKYNDANAGKPLDPSKELDPEVDQLFKGKKHTPSPDDIMSALQYELANMVKKDKLIAKQTVLKNLKRDPYYYSRLHMLNISDKDMKVDESTFSKTKAVLDEMVAAKKKANAIADTPAISQIFKDLYAKRNSHRTREE